MLPSRYRRLATWTVLGETVAKNPGDRSSPTRPLWRGRLGHVKKEVVLPTPVLFSGGMALGAWGKGEIVDKSASWRAPVTAQGALNSLYRKLHIFTRVMQGGKLKGSKETTMKPVL